MKAGLALDSIVAEKIMGWRNLRTINGLLMGQLGNNIDMTVVPFYSKNIEDAWAVLDTIIAKGFVPHNLDIPNPLAICEAAIKTLTDKG